MLAKEVAAIVIPKGVHRKISDTYGAVTENREKLIVIPATFELLLIETLT